MRVILTYIEEVPTPFTEDFFQEVAGHTLEECNFSFLQEQEVRLNVISISPEKMRELNLTYRDKDAVTDILSFAEYADREVLAETREKDIFLGELFFCAAFIRDAAKEDKVTFEREMAYIFSHGVLHLMGFDHEEAMFAIQERVTDFL